jgi:hypothetical protein
MPLVDFEKAGWDAFSLVRPSPHIVLAHSYVEQISVFPSLFVSVEVSDPAAVKVRLPLLLPPRRISPEHHEQEIVTHRARFPKPIEFYGVLKFFGQNVVVTEGAEWKKHRKIAAPAFTEKNYRMVWEETARIMQDLLNDEWKLAQEVKVENGIDITVPVCHMCSLNDR